MEGDGGGFGGLLSLGRESGRDVGTLDMLSSLSRNGLNMLAGGASSAGFNMKANWANDGRAKVSGSGFSGFYRARPGQQAVASVAVPPLRADVENLSPDECWRLILKLGKRWPALNKPTSTSVAPSPQEKTRYEPVVQASLDLLATRALEALAQTPDRHGRPPRAPKVTTQEFLSRDPPTPTTSSQLDYQTLPVYQPSVSSMDAPKTASSRTAPLTIFYAGTVKVCEDVPEDKARLIMLFAERAGLKPSGRAPASPASSSGARPGEDLQLAPPAAPSDPPAAEASSVQAPSPLLTRPEDSTAAAAEEVAIPMVTVSRQGQGPPKLLPNARKSSLARFLDTRKRPKATSGSECQPSKRHLGGALDGLEGQPSKRHLGVALDDATEDLPGRGKSTKERQIVATYDNVVVRT